MCKLSTCQLSPQRPSHLLDALALERGLHLLPRLAGEWRDGFARVVTRIKVRLQRETVKARLRQSGGGLSRRSARITGTKA
jgi:hypothetical protein